MATPPCKLTSSMKTLARYCVLVQPDGWARGEWEGYGGPRDVTSLSLSLINHKQVKS